MLNRNTVGAIVAALAILFVGSLNNSALWAFEIGDVITYPQGGWGDDPSPTNAAGLLLANYDMVYASTFSVVEAGIPGTAGFSVAFTNSLDLLAYLPALGPIGPLTSDLVDPNSSASGAFGGEVLALRCGADAREPRHSLRRSPTSELSLA